MDRFAGFAASEPSSPIPDSFFQSLLREVDDLAELKITLYAIWRIGRLDGPLQGLPTPEFVGPDLGLTLDAVQAGLEKAVSRGSLVRADRDAAAFYFLNSARGRASADAFSWGELLASADSMASRPLEQSNVFRHYELNIGPLTPMVADALKDAEANHADGWVERAIAEAARQNKRSLSYIQAILKRWKEEGRAQSLDRRDTEKDRERSLDRKIDELRRRAKK